ncbi:MAG: 1-deoxy-D-xylulose-5-phosphate reductoisomerase [Phycisphaerae bacterium]|nr:1-deoxy-D-xylulose-5-phosphate reductoisomerase [Phycisphaerae bacterium]
MSDATRRLVILGSTGSIGTSTIAVVRHLNALRAREGKPPRFTIVGLAAHANGELVREQAREFGVQKTALAQGSNGDFTHVGPNSALQLVEDVARPGDIVMGAMVGAAGLPATLAAIERGCDIALANKETLVAAGSIVMPAARSKGVALLPVDSEHSAIAQCLRAGTAPREVRRLVITASGGPFRTWPIERMRTAGPADALKHPTWSMGQKITIDSASMMNKALEVIEAHWLFDLPAEKIDAIIHPQSIVHSFVEYVDGSTIAQLSPPDMKLPIQCALTWPERLEGCSPAMPWSTLRGLDFEPVDHERFPAIGLAWQVIREGGTAGAVLNAANEIAVASFLRGEIPFLTISETVAEALATLRPRPVTTLDDVLEADRQARAWTATTLARTSRAIAHG